uniref:F-box domain-containing protein n=1 Tax=Leersia perrieri TaxID=77586 RepID=A0A0D9XCI5_9ORYZ
MDDIPDDVLEVVLLRLQFAACLIRAACVCKRWRRVIVTADIAFLRCFHANHGPDLVGHYHYVGPSVSDAAFVHVSSPVLVQGCHFSLDFVPDTDSWTVIYSCGSLVLLGKRCDLTTD